MLDKMQPTQCRTGVSEVALRLLFFLGASTVCPEKKGAIAIGMRPEIEPGTDLHPRVHRSRIDMLQERQCAAKADVGS
jgi:hypothetical protein